MTNKHYQTISWFSGNPDEVQEIAKFILDSIEQDDDEDILTDAHNFYNDVASGKCHFRGRDGRCNWTWANYSRMSLDVVFAHIRPFFVKLWEQDIMSPIHTVIGIDQNEMAHHITFYVLTNRNKLNSWRNDQVRWVYEEFMKLPDQKSPYEQLPDDITINIDDINRT